MKYIDEKLSPENRVLLDAWIDRRESRRVYPDVRSDRDRAWWNTQQAMHRFTKEKPNWQYVSQLQQQALNQAYQSSLNALGYMGSVFGYQNQS